MSRGADLFSYTPPPGPSGSELAARGIEVSAAHAEAERDGWGDEALALFRSYAAEHPTFITSDVRLWAYENGFDTPPDERAWGKVARRARLLGIVDSAGVGISLVPTHHRCFATAWQSRVFRSAAQ